MSIIDQFIKRYQKEYDFYYSIAKLVGEKCETDLYKRGIKAIVTYRAKKYDSLKSKLEKRNLSNKYISVEDIYKDIVDLAGIRVSLYFPGDRKEVNKMINELFAVEKQKEFPENNHSPSYKKRFSGYWATHYRVKLRKENVDTTQSRYTESTAEIQVASLLMHSWSEVEHDLAYKPLKGNLSSEELAILDELNGLVLTGEIALERLQKAMLNRLEKTDDRFNDNYELKTFLKNNLNIKTITNLDLGYTDLLNNFLKYYNLNSTKYITNYFDKIDYKSKLPISDQLMELILYDKNYANKFYDFLQSYLKYETTPKKNGFEIFIKSWILFEKATHEYSLDQKLETDRRFVVTANYLASLKVFSKGDLNLIKQLRNTRNQVVHGIESPDSDHLLELSKELIPLVKKIIDKIENKKVREKLLKELSQYSLS